MAALPKTEALWREGFTEGAGSFLMGG
jgi:hypothetical protein